MTPSPPLIGIFDSGVGGLSIASAIHRRLPGYPLLYLADQAHVPYGQRPVEDIQKLSLAISQYLIEQGAQVIVVACNTASAAALHPLRDQFSSPPFVGMEPAVKPAAERTDTGSVGILATPTTFQGTLYASLLDRYANGINVYQHTCPGLVSEIEAGRFDGSEARRILTEALEPMLNAGIDMIVLGCTHYTFALPLIREIAGSDVEVIDPAPAVARQTQRVLSDLDKPAQTPSPDPIRVLTTGKGSDLHSFLARFPDLFPAPVKIGEANWDGARLRDI